MLMKLLFTAMTLTTCNHALSGSKLYTWRMVLHGCLVTVSETDVKAAIILYSTFMMRHNAFAYHNVCFDGSNCCKGLYFVVSTWSMPLLNIEVHAWLCFTILRHLPYNLLSCFLFIRTYHRKTWEFHFHYELTNISVYSAPFLVCWLLLVGSLQVVDLNILASPIALLSVYLHWRSGLGKPLLTV